MSDIAEPESLQELDDAIAAAKVVVAVGGRSKPALIKAALVDQAAMLSLAKLSGIIQYEPSEFTFTAWAGTPIADVQAALGEKMQYLPFDPMLVDSGATLGGTVAAGLSGPGRARYGGLRDFLLGVKLHSGDGKVINAGGKVVKNAAGFDIPKLLVGSMGSLGVMSELTFKVFPQAQSLSTYRARCDSDSQSVDRIISAAASRWELDAIDYRPGDQAVYLRIGGPERANELIAKDIERSWSCSLERLDTEAADSFWRSIRELDWAGDSTAGFDVVIKVPVTPPTFRLLNQRFSGNDRVATHLSAAGSLLWIIAHGDEVSFVDQSLAEMELSGIVLRGSCAKTRLGHHYRSTMHDSIKTAMDPLGKFPPLS